MQETINERLSIFIEHEKISAPNIYNKIGVGRTVWYGWMNQGKAIPLGKIQAITALLSNLNARWLLTGDGEMLNESKPEKTYPQRIKIDAVEDGCPRCRTKDLEIMKLQNQLIESQKETIAALKGEQKKESLSQTGT